MPVSKIVFILHFHSEDAKIKFVLVITKRFSCILGPSDKMSSKIIITNRELTYTISSTDAYTQNS